MNSIDSFEVDVLDHTGDIETAEQVGEVARWCVNTVTDAVNVILGLSPGTIVVDFDDLTGERRP